MGTKKNIWHFIKKSIVVLSFIIVAATAIQNGRSHLVYYSHYKSNLKQFGSDEESLSDFICKLAKIKISFQLKQVERFKYADPDEIIRNTPSMCTK